MRLRLPITDGCFYNPFFKFEALWCSWLTRCPAITKNMSLAFVLAHEAEIRRAVAVGSSKRSIFKRLKCNNETLDRALLILGIDYKGNRGGKGYKVVTNKKPLTEFLKSGSGLR